MTAKPEREDADVSTSPGIGPGESVGTPIDEAAKTTPFIRSVEDEAAAAADEANSPVALAPKPTETSLSVEIDGGWSLDAGEKTQADDTSQAAAVGKATTTLVGPGSPMPAVATPAAEVEPESKPAADAPPAPAVAAPPTEEAKIVGPVFDDTPTAVGIGDPPPPSEPSKEPTPEAAKEPAPEPAAKEEAPKTAEPEKDTAPARPSPVRAATTPAAPSGPIQVKVFGRTDVGLVREHNEDNFLIADLTTGNRSLLPEVRSHGVGPRGSLFVVCDGMGGAAAGEVASLLAVDTIYELLQGSESPRNGLDLARTMVDAIEEGGRRIFAAARLDRSRRGMGTTVTGACLLDGTAYFAQVGDSRAYVVRGTQIELVTRDQSLVNQLIEAGQLTEEEAEAFEHSNIILQALGTAAEVSVDVTHVPLRKGDILILCSDGLSGAVTADQMKEVVLGTPEPIEACKRLTEMANAAGGHDNITVIVAQFDGEGLADASPDDRVSFQRVSLPPGPRSSQPPQSVATEAPVAGSPYRATMPDIDGPPPAEDTAEPEPRSGGGITLLLLLLALLVGAAVAYVFFSGVLTARAPSSTSSVPSAVAVPPPASIALPSSTSAAGSPTVPIVSNALATVTFLSGSTNARLRVGGLDRGSFENGRVTLELPVGSHEVAVIVDGSPVSSRTISVTSQGPNEVSMDEGAAEAPAPLAPVAPVPAGVAPPEPDPTSEPPQATTEPAQRPAGPRVRTPVPPSEPGKSPERVVPPRAPGDLPVNPF